MNGDDSGKLYSIKKALLISGYPAAFNNDNFTGTDPELFKNSFLCL